MDFNKKKPKVSKDDSSKNFQIDSRQLVFEWIPEEQHDGRAINFVNDLNLHLCSDGEDSNHSLDGLSMGLSVIQREYSKNISYNLNG